MKKNTIKKKKYSRRITKRKNNKKKYTKRKNNKKKGGAAAVSVLEQYEIDNFKMFLENPPLGATDVWYGSEKNIDEFLDQKSNSSEAKIKLENNKEIRIACFTNYYRMSIYTIIRNLDEYLGNYADVVISGGDGLNINLESENRLISPDIDVKVIINTQGYNEDNWLYLYRKVVIMTEYFIDWVICCLNYKEDTFNTLFLGSVLLNIPDPRAFTPEKIRELFYKFVHSYESQYSFLINEENFVNNDLGQRYSFFNNYLLHSESEKRKFETIGYPWARRTSDMKAGNQDTPFTLMNVKLIAMDLRYKGGYNYFGSLAGVLDIVVAVPGHIGHNGMNKFQGIKDNTFKGYGLTTELGLPGSNIVGPCYSINLNYYIYEMIKMIMYGLRTKNGKVYKDMNRFKTLLYIGKTFSDGTTAMVISGGMTSIENVHFPTNLKNDCLQLIEEIQKFVPEKDIVDFVERINELEKENLDELIDIDKMTNPDPNLFDKKAEILEGSSNNLFNFEPPNLDKKGGGSTEWKNYNSNTVGKTLDNLNIFDFFKKNAGYYAHLNIKFNEDEIVIFQYTKKGLPVRKKNNYYKLSLQENDKLYIKTIPIKENPKYDRLYETLYPTLKMEDNYDKGDIFNGKRIDYESLTSIDDINQPVKYDLLTKPPYTCYSQINNPRMILRNYLKEEFKFNTSTIFTNKFSGKLFSNLIYTINDLLKNSPNSIIHLAQFRHFPNQLDPDYPERIIDIEKEKVICAAFIYSSIMKGFDVTKLTRKKVRFDIQPYKLVMESLIKFIVNIEKYLH